MSIGRLIVEFEAKTGKFETDTGRAAKIMEKRAREIDKQVTKIGVAVGAAIGAAVVGISALIKKSIDAADEMDKLAQKTGLSIEAVSQLSYAAKLSGVEDLGASLTKFNKSIGDAAQGTKAQAEAFKTLGVEIRNADGTLKDTETLFNDTADAISKLPDGIKKTQLAIDLFGKSGAQLIPFLNEGKAGLAALRKEADDLGLTLDERTGKAADGFNDNLDRLQAVVGGVGIRLATELAPELERLTGLLVDTAKESDAVGRSASALSTFIKGAALGFIALANVVQIAAKSLAGLAAVNVAFYSGDFRGAVEAGRAALSDIKGDIDDVTGAYERLFNEASKPLPAARAGSRGGGDVIVDEEAAKGRNKALKEAQDEAEKALQKLLDAEEKQRESIKSVIEALQEEGATLNATNGQIQARTIAKLGGTSAEQEQAKALADYVDALKEANKEDEERARIFEQTRTPAEQYAATIERLNKLYDYGRKDANTYFREVEAAGKRMDDALDKNKDKVKTWEEELKGAAEEAGRSMQRSLSDFLFNPFEGGLKGMVRSFAQTLQRMAADLLATGILKKLGALFQGGAAGGSSGGGFWSTAASWAATLFGGGKADGGPVMGGTAYLVGERGPELMVPKTAGTIVPNDRMGGSTVINITTPISAPRGTVSQETQSQVANRVGRSVALATKKYS